MRPKKKENAYDNGTDFITSEEGLFAYNQAIDDMNKWIDEAKIEDVMAWMMIQCTEPKCGKEFLMIKSDMDKIAKAIRKMLKGEK